MKDNAKVTFFHFSLFEPYHDTCIYAESRSTCQPVHFYSLIRVFCIFSVDSTISRLIYFYKNCRIIVNDDEQLEEHNSVHKVRLNQQQPSHVSLDECLKLFTKEERVSCSFYCMYIRFH